MFYGAVFDASEGAGVMINWKVRVGAAFESPVDEGVIVLAQGGTRWNDFGYAYNVGAKIKYSGEIISFPLYLVPFDSVGRAFKTVSDAFADGFASFVSIMANPKSYKVLAATLELQDYESLLRCLSEVSAVKYVARERVSFVDGIISSEPFRLGVLRSSKAFISLLNGVESSFTLEPDDDARQVFGIHVKVPGALDVLSMKFRYVEHEYFQDRVHCLIGKNGVGKTQLLRGIVVASARAHDALHTNGPATVLRDRHGKAIEDDECFIDYGGVGFNFKRIVAYSSDWATVLPVASDVGRFDFKFFNLGGEASTESHVGNLSYLLASIFRVDDPSLSLSKWQIFSDALSGIVSMQFLAIPVLESCPEYCCFSDLAGGKWAYISRLSGEQKILDTFGSIDKFREPSFFPSQLQAPIRLSSGQRSIFRFALHFIAHAGFGTLLIIDEPETYLHPNLISDYMMLLYSILEQTRSVAIVATHSAYVVREAPTHCVHLLEALDGGITSRHVYAKTLGASVSELSFAVFGDSTASAYYQKISREVSRSGLSFEQVIQSYGDIFSASMLVEIRSRLERRQDD